VQGYSGFSETKGEENWNRSRRGEKKDIRVFDYEIIKKNEPGGAHLPGATFPKPPPMAVVIY
jgi:hypothetical protein